MRITDIDLIPILEPEATTEDGWWVTSPLDVFLEPFVRPIGVTAEEQRLARNEVTNVIVAVSTTDGLTGYGTVGVGSPASMAVIGHHLAPILLGADPFEVERLWELMFRTTLNIGRKGLVLEAISALDIALWDIIGKATGQPLYNLLGGRTRDRIRAYASQSYAFEDLGRVRAEALRYRSQGFTALKMRFGYGPTDGRPGIQKNLELVATVREAIGPDLDLMADAYMGWDVSYAIRMIRMLEEFDLLWIEEPLLPDDLDGYARLRATVNTPIAAGEHEYTRFGFRDLIARGAVDIVQLDVNRMGGITEARKVWALAAAHSLPVIPHSPQAHNAHLIMAHLNSPLIEYFPQDSQTSGYTFYDRLFDGEPRAVDGYVELSDAPGLGISLNLDAVDAHRASV